MTQSDINHDHLSYCIASKYRKAVMLSLLEQAKTPKMLNQETYDEAQISHVSRALNELRDKGLVELLVSESVQKGRLYGLSETGREIAEHIQDRDV